MPVLMPAWFGHQLKSALMPAPGAPVGDRRRAGGSCVLMHIFTQAKSA
jgi:hypothetical protein